MLICVEGSLAARDAAGAQCIREKVGVRYPAAPGIALAPGGGALERGGTAKCCPMVIPGDLLQTWFVRVTGFPAMAVDAKVLEPGAFGHLHGCVSSRARYHKRQLARPLCSLYVPGSNRSFEMSRYGRPDRHHGEI